MANLQNLKPFVKGDPRCNRKGRPKSFDQLRKMAKAISHESVDAKTQISLIDSIMRKWATSRDPRLQLAFVEYAFGKVPQSQKHIGIPAIIKVKVVDGD
jgi:hypothetical protein